MSEQTIPPSLKAIAAEVAHLLQERKETISVAETAAGGLISAAILTTPGASRIYKGGLTANIDSYRGPTPDIVAGLAENVRLKLESTYCVSELTKTETGRVAQQVRRVDQPPTGLRKIIPRNFDCGTEADRRTSSGYVALAVASETETKKVELDTGLGTDREQNMLAFAIHALKLVKEVVGGQAKI